MRRLVSFLVLLALPASAEEGKEVHRLDECAAVLREVLAIPENIPRDLLNKAYCVAVIPSVKKFALGVGGRYGKGAVLCRKAEGGKAEGTGSWGAPLMITLGGGSLGLQIGGQAADFVLLIMNPRGVESLLKSQSTLGADASVAAGPKGRTGEAATDLRMNAEILTYSRSQGVFAGVSLEGGVLKPDGDANERLYGAPVNAKRVLVTGGYAVPAPARDLVSVLESASPRRIADR